LTLVAYAFKLFIHLEICTRGNAMFTQSVPDGFYYREINDAEILRPLMGRGHGDVKIFYKLKKFREERKWREVINILANIGYEKGNQFFNTHELLGELCSEKIRFRVDDLSMSLGRVWDVMQKDYWACAWETDRRTNDFYKDRLVRPMLDKLQIGHVSMEHGDMVQFKGMTFILFDEAVYDGKGYNAHNLVGYKQSWGQLIRRTDGEGEVEGVTIKLLPS